MAMAFTSEDGAPPRPTGTVTFLFTDVEGSTQRWERAEQGMDAALARHDAILRTGIAAHGGVVFKTVGDAFCAAFSTAQQAAAAALEAQRTLSAQDFSAVGGLRIRIALHTGTAQERDDDYFGPAVNRVARLLAIGHGGQILISQTTANLMPTELPERSTLRDLGAHRLKDLTRPEHVFQLVAAGLSDAFPALRSIGDLPNNLPPQLTSFVGRDNELAEIKDLVKNARLVTLVGSGGAGKTRCAVQVGAELLESFDDGVWLTELAPIADASLVAGEIARVLGVAESPNRPLLETLLAHLERRQLLLVLDNCEHVLDEVRRVAAATLRSAASVSILATSRESLNIAGERAFRLPSLAVPPALPRITARTAQSYGAVALFADRAQASDTRFALTDENASSVSEIAVRLDGIPLAIELAAARVKMLSPQRIVTLLNERFRVLTGGDHSALPRHRTMRALIDWSYDLLSDDERELFRKLSIFAGGFTLRGAAAVCGDPNDEIAILDLLSSLVDKSLVQADTDGHGRYRLLESTRQYAREKLIESGEEAAVARSHAGAFLALAYELEDAYKTTPDDEWFAHAETELENWRAALDWALTSRADVILGQRLVSALGRQWAFLIAAEGRRWIAAAHASTDETTPERVRADLDLAEAQLDGVLGLHRTSLAAAERALARYEAMTDRDGVARAQRHAGRSLVFLRSISEGEVLLHAALRVFRETQDRVLTGATLENLAIARNALGDLETARKFYAEALALFKATGSERLAASVATNLAEAEFRDGNSSAALQLVGEALASDRNLSYRTAFLMCNKAAYLVALGRHEEARSTSREALATAEDLNYEIAIAWALQHLAASEALRAISDDSGARERQMRAARLLGYVDEFLTSRGVRREYTEEREYDAMRAALERSLGQAETERLMGDGRSWNGERAVAEGTLL
jgi:predicted ATPase/class 3 adenylate cyclase